MVVVNVSQFVTPGFHSDTSGNFGKGSCLPERDVQVYLFTVFRTRTWSIQPRGDGKILRTPSPEGVGGEVGEPRNLFPRLGVG